jgi:hypothetical protein
MRKLLAVPITGAIIVSATTQGSLRLRFSFLRLEGQQRRYIFLENGSANKTFSPILFVEQSQA